MRVLPNGLDRSRFCFVTGKRVGNAVARNRVKRRLREVVRNSAPAPGWDTVLIARRGAGEADFRQLEKGRTQPDPPDETERSAGRFRDYA